MTWKARLEARVAGEADKRAEITVSKEVFEKAVTHTVRIDRSTTTHTIGRVTSHGSGNEYRAELWVDEDGFYPSFPYVWKCSCKWGRERFLPCSHVIALALYRGRTYDNERPRTISQRATSPRDH